MCVCSCKGRGGNHAMDDGAGRADAMMRYKGDKMDSTTGQVSVEMPACEAAMFQKMPPSEPRFTLRAQDMTADLTVIFWVRVNAYLKRAVARGTTLPDAWMRAAD